MLGKLIKYDFKAVGRLLWPLYLAAIVLSAITKFMFSAEWEVPFVLSSIAMFLLFTAIGIVTIIIIVQQFHKQLLGDTGYLYFTLPVKTSSLIWSKVIVNILYMIFSTITGLMSIFILFYKEIIEFMGKFMENFERSISIVEMGLQSELNTDISLWGIMGIFIGLALIIAITQILFIYFAIALGNMSNKHKGGMSLVAYFCIYMFWQIVSSIIIICITNNYNIVSLGDGPLPMGFLEFCGFLGGYTLIQAAIYFVGTNWIFKKKLNLA